MGIIVNTPEPMSKVRVITSKDYSADALKALHRAGVLQVAESEELKPVDRERVEQERRRVSGLLSDIEDVLAYIPKKEMVPLGEDIEVIYTRQFDDIDDETRSLCTKLGNMHRQEVKLRDKARELTELKGYLEPLGERVDVKLRDLNFSGDYLFSRVFVLPSESFETAYSSIKPELLESIDIPLETETILYAIAKTENQEIAESTVKSNGGKILSIPDEDLTPREFVEVAEKEAQGLEGELTKIHQEIETKTRENLQKLALLREALVAENDKLSVLEKASEAKYVTMIEGWVPVSSLETAISELKEDIGYVFIDTRPPEKSEEPPTKMRNPRALKPFQTVVNLFGIPKYREWDPTPIIAYSFAFFFGVMLGDAIYSICLLLLTRFTLHIFVDDPESEGFILFQRLLYISSGVGLVLGVLTGTYLGDFYRFFGFENLALSRTIQGVYLDCMTFIVVALVIGLIHVNIGHVLALIQGIRRRQKHIILGRIGLFVLEVPAIPWVMHFVGIDVLPLAEQTYSILIYGMLAGIALLIAASLVERGPFLGSIFWLFDVTGLLGDVMSYARLAGVGLATYYLAYCFNLMSTLISGMLPIIIGPIIGILILIFGHVLNLLLSSITCFVHSLRLCFVEFLFKFYEGGGREYSPFKLRKRKLVPVRAKA